MLPGMLNPSRITRLLTAAAVLAATAAQAQETVSPCGDSALGIPQRDARASGGGAFIDSVAGLSDDQRDQAIRRELLAGNLPRFLRQALPATLTGRLPGGERVRLTLCVLSDYLSVGSDDDHLRVPMSLGTALAVATRFGFTLPTPRIVDLIYRQAAVRLVPQPLPPGEQMRSAAYVRLHHALVEQQRAAVGALPGALSAGHKKDLVLSNKLWSRPAPVAIYGWHRSADAPIQPLSAVHGARYADYSHGVRLVSQVMYVNGKRTSIFDVLADQRWAGLLSSEGPLTQVLELQSAALQD